MERRFRTLSTAILLALTARKARADGFSAAALGGNGFKDGYGGAVGLRAGVTLPAIPVYAGGTFLYHFGTTDSEGTLKVLLYLGPESGYDVALGPVTLRPYIGVGYASLSTAVPTATLAHTLATTEHTGHFALWPGLAALFPIDSAFAGLDGRYVVINDSDNLNALSVFVTAGLDFR